jgi:2-oxoisovalerate dehydrogenase E1 component
MTKCNQVPNISRIQAIDYPNVSLVTSDEQYWSSHTSAELIWGYFCLVVIRQFEQALLNKEIEPLIHGPIHSSIGQEAVAVGTAMALTTQDKITSTHRAHHHFLAKAIAFYGPPSDDVWSLGSRDSLRCCLRRTMAEIMGLMEGWVGGRGGSMHLFDDASGNIGTQAIVAGNIPYVSGIAFAEKFRNTGNVALAFLGDGAISIGPFHEGLCVAKAYSLPVIFVIENNLYAVATSAREATALDDLVIRAGGYNIPGLIVDGMDPMAMKRAVQLARSHVTNGNGPVLIEAKTYRYFHQSGGIPGSAFGYRTKEEEKSWADRDPILFARRFLIQRKMASQSDIGRIDTMAEDLIGDAVDFCTARHSDGPRHLRPELVPAPAVATRSVRSNGQEFERANYRSISDYVKTREVKFVHAKSQVIARWLELHAEAFVVGEDVANMKGGPYGATRDALARYPQRVLNAPIAEGGMIGLGHGAAVMGMRPIVEFMFCDFGLIAADELFNQVATCRYMYNNRVNVPLVVRSRCSAGRGYGAQHSGDTVGLFALYPGWRIVAPSTPFDYIGLFNSAMNSQDPVLVLEHHDLDQICGPIPDADLDYMIKLGTAELRRVGTDLTVVTYLSMVPRVVRIADELSLEEGIEIEVIDLRTLDYASMDLQKVIDSVARTRRLVIVEQAMETQGLGSYIASRAYDAFSGTIMPPVRILGSLPVPVAVSKVQEQAVLISDDRIRDGLLQAAAICGTPAPHLFSSADGDRTSKPRRAPAYHGPNLNRRQPSR